MPVLILVFLSRYNNKTYRVDDIDWSKTPQDKFDTATGEKISFVEYYKKVCLFLFPTFSAFVLGC